MFFFTEIAHGYSLKHWDCPLHNDESSACVARQTRYFQFDTPEIGWVQYTLYSTGLAPCFYWATRTHNSVLILKNCVTSLHFNMERRSKTLNLIFTDVKPLIVAVTSTSPPAGYFVWSSKEQLDCKLSEKGLASLTIVFWQDNVIVLSGSTVKSSLQTISIDGRSYFWAESVTGREEKGDWVNISKWRVGRLVCAGAPLAALHLGWLRNYMHYAEWIIGLISAII